MKILTVRTSSYEKDGVTKYSYMTIGKFIEGKNGPFITLDVNLGIKGWGKKGVNEEGIINIFDTDDKGGHAGSSKSSSTEEEMGF